MLILPVSFTLLQWNGLWFPRCSPWRMSYRFYTASVLVTVYSSILSEVIYLMTTEDSIKDTINNLVILLSMIGASAKATTVVFRRKRIINLIRILGTYPCCGEEPDEIVIQDVYDQMIK